MKNKTTRLTRLSLTSLFVLAWSLLFSEKVVAQTLQFDNALLSAVIHEIEDVYGKRFLYRDALIAGKRVSLSGNRNDILAALGREMLDFNLKLEDSDATDVVVISTRSETSSKLTRTLTGFVFDADDGTRLPGATILIHNESNSSGVISNNAGRFVVKDILQKEFQLEVRYIGYESYRVDLKPDKPFTELSIRLRPLINSVSEVTVYGTQLQSVLDTTWTFLMEPTLPSGYDDQSLIRSFQVLPAISISSATSGDFNVRGSQSSGFRIELDGAPIFGQQHLFGLYDVFNPDAISQSALYYDTSPSTFEDAGGGILSLRTRPGSVTSTKAMASVSNSTSSVTFETPLVKEKVSLMISGRSSTPLASSWYGSEGIIARGHGIPIVVGSNDSGVENNLFDVSTNGSFYDLHGRLVVENKNGSSIDASGYFASEQSSAETSRIFDMESQGNRTSNSLRIANERMWDNFVSRVGYSWALRPDLHMTTSVSSSHYTGDVLREDFVERRNDESSFSSFKNQNSMAEIKLSQRSYFSIDNANSLEFGLDLKKITSSYFQDVGEENQIDVSVSPSIVAASVAYNTEQSFWNGALGLKSQYVRDRGFFVLSPKLHLAGQIGGRNTWSLNVSRNNEFVQNLDLGDELRSKIWLAGSQTSKPTETNTVSLSNQFQTGERLAFRVDAYLKKINNLWEYRSGLRTSSDERGRLLTYDSESLTKGLEFMTSLRVSSDVLASVNYSLSKSEVWNDLSEEGKRFAAEWDRRHQISSRVVGDIDERFSFSVSALFATGAPNQLSYLIANEENRLGNYFRLDVGLDSKWNVGNQILYFSVFCFNATDRKNPWYRTPVSFVNRVSNQEGDRNPRFVNVDVFDLGILPSFKLRLSL